MMKRWYVVSTKPRKEHLVSICLEREKIHFFLPKIRERVYRLGRPVTIVTPLFPGYIFVEVEDNITILNKIRWTIGVKKILGNGDIPVPIDEDVILFIKGQTAEDGLIRRGPKFRTGDKVRIKAGILKDLVGIIKEPTSREGRIKVLMNIVRYSAAVEVDESLLTKD